jgi:hypothetical protein
VSLRKRLILLIDDDDDNDDKDDGNKASVANRQFCHLPESCVVHANRYYYYRAARRPVEK